MRISSALVALVGATAGMATGVATYQSSAEVTPPDHDDSPVLAVGQPLPAPPPQVETVLADCVAPAVLRGGACVTTEVRQVPAPGSKGDKAPQAEPAAQSPQPAPAEAPAKPSAPKPAAPAPAPATPAPGRAAPGRAAPAAVPATWNGAAGSVTVVCDGSAIALQAATPASGYAAEVDDSGPEEVRVDLEGDDTRARVEAACAGGVPHFEVDQD